LELPFGYWGGLCFAKTASTGKWSDQLAIYNNGFVNASYVYMLTVGTPTPPSVTLNYTFNGGALTLPWPVGYKLQSRPRCFR
jgi:hypothetical protein